LPGITVTTHPIGLAALTVLELAPPEMVSCAADAGFERVRRMLAKTRRLLDTL
jgi:hypothetical protein